jgi:FixJ family two-component response regulator
MTPRMYFPLRSDHYVLVVEDDNDLAQSIARYMKGKLVAKQASCVSRAREKLEGILPKLAGLIIEVNLPDGSGIDFGVEVRQRLPGLPMLFITEHVSPMLTHRALVLNAPLLVKPVASINFSPFVVRMLGRLKHDGSPDPVPHVERYLEQHQVSLTKREHEILSLAIMGRTRPDIARSIGIAENTAKSLITRLLYKFNERNLSRLAARIWTSHEAQSIRSIAEAS